MSDPIYTVTTMSFDGRTGLAEHRRTPGWFRTFADAERCVRENHGDIFEAGYYSHAVIECVGEGLYNFREDESPVWYAATYKLVDGCITQENGNPSVARVAAPHGRDSSIGFGIG